MTAHGAIIMQVLTVEELSKLIHKAPQSIYNDRVRNPQSLPPIAAIPGSRRLLFTNVDLWLTSHIQTPQTSEVDTQSSLKRGRPTKAEQIARSKLKL
jgi:hypothetical protein